MDIEKLQQKQNRLREMLVEVERRKQEILIQIIEIQGAIKYIKSEEEIKVETK